MEKRPGVAKYKWCYCKPKARKAQLTKKWLWPS